ncbi:hypothetical protein Mgra_00007707 [Meloidogyne graminicola]|uniref:Uncharacterized protein n=1 Tax=Meloidogyne graminicola TaxID=189291 RepID=A0A8S9ZHX4_9BILA|nr:hypothetical protein Mgra_00007707 [Meloidogyne graminicola]
MQKLLKRRKLITKLLQLENQNTEKGIRYESVSVEPFCGRQLECVFINPPLVQDFNRTEEEVEADRQDCLIFILKLASHLGFYQLAINVLDMPSPWFGCAHGIEDRLLTYFHIYSPIRKFEAAQFLLQKLL